MAAAITQLAATLGGKVLSDNAVTNTVVANPTSGAITMYHLEFDNTMNSSVTYIKIYEATSVTLGTTQPSLVVKAAAATKEYVSIPTGLEFATGASYVATTTASNSTGSPSAPSNACSMAFIYT
tara:strand:- start:124 stop:495 length:372 start_codon:yes stop_codon:yes gene_type:complete